MLIKNLIPKSLVNQIRLFKKKKQYPQSNISTHKIHNSVELGVGSSLSEDTDIREKVTIGNYSYVNRGTIIASGTVGNYCSIGYNCQIGMFEHPTNHMSTSPFIYNKSWGLLKLGTWDEIYSPPTIGNDVWIGSNALVLQV